jgi:hypothetical protein
MYEEYTTTIDDLDPEFLAAIEAAMDQDDGFTLTDEDGEEFCF